MRRFKLFLALALLPLGALPAAAQEVDPWSLLKNVRKSLVESGPTGASFVQTFIPAGFTSGEKESGRLALHLPDCLRWDYTEPYPKSFLLCGGVVHAWNEEDKTGRRYRVDRKNEPGLDLLLLGVDDLKERYRASAKAAEGGRVEVSLSPKEKKLAELTDAVLTVDPESQRVVAIAYHDREGNLTRFEINGYQGLSRQGSFSPPAGVRWEEQ
ncbi:MAG TPA: outer membrane lipoprotein carrier protein LolA [Thermoanaerobaculia bacterium]|nr:outer membrane lipoprotein carrier protein LolA [Thermoanaerobaculia bacterium]